MRWHQMVLLSLGLLVSGCASFCPKNTSDEVSIPVRTPCNVDEPTVPVMPLDTVPKNADFTTMLSQALAEIETRRGYEEVLREHFRKCKFGLN